MKTLCTIALLSVWMSPPFWPIATAATQGESVELRSDLVSFPVVVAVADPQNRPRLKKEDFKVFEAGKPQEITHFSAVDVPVDIVLSVDTSGSMKSDIEIVREAANSFVDRMRPQDSGAAVSFAHTVVLLSDLTADRKALHAALGQIAPGKGTSFYDALYLISEEVLKKPRSPRKAIIALTDGMDSSSYYTFQQVSKELERTGAAVYFIEIDTEHFTIKGLRKEQFTLSPAQLERYRKEFKPEDNPLRYKNPFFFTPDETAEIGKGLYQMARRELRSLAERTGGRVFPLKTLKDLTSIYTQISAELGTLYSIGYYPTNTRRDGTWRPVKVIVDVPGAEARARSGYWAASH